MLISGEAEAKNNTFKGEFVAAPPRAQRSRRPADIGQRARPPHLTVGRRRRRRVLKAHCSCRRRPKYLISKNHCRLATTVGPSHRLSCWLPPWREARMRSLDTASNYIYIKRASEGIKSRTHSQIKCSQASRSCVCARVYELSECVPVDDQMASLSLSLSCALLVWRSTSEPSGP